MSILTLKRQLKFRMALQFPSIKNTLTNCAFFYSKIVELEEELRVVGNNLKSLEVSEEKVGIHIAAFPLNNNQHLKLLADFVLKLDF